MPNDDDSQGKQGGGGFNVGGWGVSGWAKNLRQQTEEIASRAQSIKLGGAAAAPEGEQDAQEGGPPEEDGGDGGGGPGIEAQSESASAGGDGEGAAEPPPKDDPTAGGGVGGGGDPPAPAAPAPEAAAQPQAGPREAAAPAPAAAAGGSAPATPLSSRNPDDVSKEELMEILSKMNKRLKALNAARIKLMEESKRQHDDNGRLLRLVKEEILSEVDIEDAKRARMSKSRSWDDEGDGNEKGDDEDGGDDEIRLLQYAWRAADERKSLMLQDLQNEFRVITMKTEAEIEKVRKQAEREKEEEVARVMEKLRDQQAMHSIENGGGGDGGGVTDANDGDLRSQLDDARGRAEDLGREVAALREAASSLDEAAAEGARARAELEERHAEELDRVRSEAEAASEASNSALEESRRAHGEEVEQLRRSLTSEFEAKIAAESSDAAAASVLEETLREAESRIDELTRRAEEAEAGLERGQGEMEELRKRLDAANDAAEAAKSSADDSATDNEEERVAKEKEKIDAALAEQKGMFLTKLKAYKEKQEGNVRQLQGKLRETAEALKGKTDELQNLRERLGEEHGAEMAALRAEQEEAGAKLVERHEKELEERCQALREERGATEGRLSEVQAVYDDLLKRDEERSGRVKELEEEVASHRAELERCAAENEERMAELRGQHEQSMAQLRELGEADVRERAVQIDDLTGQLAALREEAAEGDRARNDAELAVAAARAERDAEMEALRSDAEGEKAESEQRMRTLVDEHAAQIDTLEREKAVALSQLQDTLNDRLQSKGEEHDAQIAELKSAQEAEIATAEAKYRELQKDHESLRSQWEAKAASNVEEKLKEQIDSLRRDHGAAIARLEEDKTSSTEQLNAAMQERLEAAAQERVAAMGALEDELQSLRTQMQAKDAMESQIESENSAKLAELENRVVSERDSSKKELDALLEEHRAALAKVEDEKKSLSDRLTVEAEQQLQRTLEEHAATVGRMEDEIGCLKTQLQSNESNEEMRNAMEQEFNLNVAKWENLISTEKDKANKQVYELNAKHQAALDNLDQEKMSLLDQLKSEHVQQLKRTIEEHAAIVGQMGEEVSLLNSQLRSKESIEQERKVTEQEHMTKIAELEDLVACERDKSTEKVNELKADHQAALNKLEQDKVSLSDDLRSEYEQQRQCAVDEHTAIVGRLEEKVQSLEAQLQSNESNEELRDVMEQQYSAKIAELENLVASEKARSSEQLNLLKEEHQGALDSLENDKTSMSDQLKNNYDQQLQRVMEQHSATVDRLEEKVHSLEAELQANESIEAQRSVQIEVEYSAKVTELENRVSSERQASSKELQALKEEHQSAVDKFEEEKLQLTSQLRDEFDQELQRVTRGHGATVGQMEEEMKSLKSQLQSYESMEHQHDAMEQECSAKVAEMEKLVCLERDRSSKELDELKEKHAAALNRAEQEKTSLSDKLNADFDRQLHQATEKQSAVIRDLEEKVHSLKSRLQLNESNEATRAAAEKDYGAKIAELENRIASERDKSKKELDALREENQATLNGLENERSSYSDKLKSDCEQQLRRAVEEHAATVSQMEQGKVSLSSQLEASKTNEEKLKAMADMHAAKISELETLISSERESSKEQQQALKEDMESEISKRLQDSRETIARLEEEKRALLAQAQAKEATLGKEQKEVESERLAKIAELEKLVATERDAAESKIVAMKEEHKLVVEALEKQKRMLSGQIKSNFEKRLRTFEEKHTASMSKLQSAASEKDTTIERLKSEVSSAQALSSSLNDDNSSLQEKIAKHQTFEQTLKAEVQQLKQKIEESSEESSAATSALLDEQDKLNEANTALKKQVVQLKGENVSSKNKVEELSKKLDALSVNLTFMVEKTKGQENQLLHAKKQEEKLKKAESELKTLREEANQLKFDQAQSNGLVSRLQAEKDSSERKHGQRTALLGMLEAQLSELKATNHELTQDLEASKESSLKKEEELQWIKAQLDKSEAGKTEANQSRETDSKMVKALQKEVSTLQQQMARKSSTAQRLLKEREAECKKLRETNKVLQQENDKGTLSDRRIFELAAKQSSRESVAATEIEIRDRLLERLKDALIDRDSELATVEHTAQQVEGTVEELCRVRRREDVNLDYLKGVVVQYLSKPPGSSERASLLPVIATLLQFDAEDYKLIEEGKSKVGWWGQIMPTEMKAPGEASAPAPAATASFPFSLLAGDASSHSHDSEQQVAPLLASTSNSATDGKRIASSNSTSPNSLSQRSVPSKPTSLQF